MADLEERLEAAQRRITTATSKQARADVERDNAKDSIAAARRVLDEEYGIKTSADIKRVRGELEAEIEKSIGEVEKALEEAGA